MNLNTYQKKARKTAIYPKKYSVIYPALGLSGETGEVLEKIKKEIRGGYDHFANVPFLEAVRLELGDVLWYVSNIASDLGFTLDDIAKINLKKLAKRQKENKLQGNGDNR